MATYRSSCARSVSRPERQAPSSSAPVPEPRSPGTRTSTPRRKARRVPGRHRTGLVLEIQIDVRRPNRSVRGRLVGCPGCGGSAFASAGRRAARDSGIDEPVRRRRPRAGESERPPALSLTGTAPLGSDNEWRASGHRASVGLAALSETIDSRLDGGHLSAYAVRLDCLSLVADALGAGAAERIVDVTRRRMQEWAGPTRNVIQLAGADFLTLRSDRPDAMSALHDADRLRHLLGQPVDVGGHRVARSVSVGVATTAGRAQSPPVLLASAYATMRAAHVAGGTGSCCTARTIPAGSPSCDWNCSSQPSATTRCGCSTNRSSICGPARCWPSRRCCGGSIPSAVCSSPTTSSRSPRPRTRSGRSASGVRSRSGN